MSELFLQAGTPEPLELHRKIGQLVLEIIELKRLLKQATAELHNKPKDETEVYYGWNEYVHNKLKELRFDEIECHHEGVNKPLFTLKKLKSPIPNWARDAYG